MALDPEKCLRQYAALAFSELLRWLRATREAATINELKCHYGSAATEISRVPCRQRRSPRVSPSSPKANPRAVGPNAGGWIHAVGLARRTLGWIATGGWRGSHGSQRRDEFATTGAGGGGTERNDSAARRMGMGRAPRSDRGVRRRVARRRRETGGRADCLKDKRASFHDRVSGSHWVAVESRSGRRTVDGGRPKGAIGNRQYAGLG